MPGNSVFFESIVDSKNSFSSRLLHHRHIRVAPCAVTVNVTVDDNGKIYKTVFEAGVTAFEVAGDKKDGG
jgi:hypothetical protein